MLQSRDIYCQQIEQIFTRWYKRSFKDPQNGSMLSTGALSQHESYDIPGTVRGYLTKNAKPQELQELLRLTDQLLLEEGLI
jgi:hypothetical protein